MHARTTVDPHVAERFVRENWRSLAATAWRLHLRYGLGDLVVEWTVVQRWRQEPARPFETRYTTKTENNAFNAVIAGHDPKAAIVIAFSDTPFADAPPPSAAASEPLVALRSGTALAAMTITAEPPPPAAHRARGH